MKLIYPQISSSLVFLPIALALILHPQRQGTTLLPGDKHITACGKQQIVMHRAKEAEYLATANCQN